MKTSHSFLLVIACVAMFLVGNLARPSQPAAALAPIQQNDACINGRSISVSGAAVVYAVPDRALLQLGVQSNGATPQIVQEDNARAIQRVINAVKALGIDAQDIATDYFLVYPLYDSYNSSLITGYRIDNTVSITLRNVELIDDVLITALTTGANEVQDVQLYTSELRQYRDQARELAMQAAREKAAAISGAAEAAVGCMQTISENTWTQYYGSWRGGREAAMWAQNVIQNGNISGESAADLGDSPMSLGQIAIRAEISASYSLTD
jgi:uncharacterized protein YggE